MECPVSNCTCTPDNCEAIALAQRERARGKANGWREAIAAVEKLADETKGRSARGTIHKVEAHLRSLTPAPGKERDQ